MLWRISRAKILVRQGDGERAEALAREAVQLGEATDLLNTRADMLCDLADVLRLAGRPAEAVPALTRRHGSTSRRGTRRGSRGLARSATELSPASSSA